MQEEEMEEAGFTIKASQRWDGLKGPTIHHSPHLSIKKQSLEETQGSKSWPQGQVNLGREPSLRFPIQCSLHCTGGLFTHKQLWGPWTWWLTTHDPQNIKDVVRTCRDVSFTVLVFRLVGWLTFTTTEKWFQIPTLFALSLRMIMLNDSVFT